jgi:thioredoxin-like negative regulator of GroEL
MDLIASSERVVLKVWMDNCPNCVTFAPIFETVASTSQGFVFASYHLPRSSGGASEIKKLMTPDEKGQVTAPCLFFFHQGKQVMRNYGLITEAQLRDWLTPAEQKLARLYMRKGEIMSGNEELPAIDAKIKELKKVLGGI